MDPFHWRVLMRTFWLSVLTTFLTLLLGYPLAYHLTYAPKRRKRWLLMLIISPLLVSVVVRGFAWIILLGRVGMVNQFVHWLTGRGLVLIGTPAGDLVVLVHGLGHEHTVIPDHRFAGDTIRGVNADQPLVHQEHAW